MTRLYDLCTERLQDAQRRGVIVRMGDASVWWMGGSNNTLIRCRYTGDTCMLSLLPLGQQDPAELWLIRRDGEHSMVRGRWEVAAAPHSLVQAIETALPYPRIGSFYGVSNGIGQVIAIFHFTEEPDSQRPVDRRFVLLERRPPALFQRVGRLRILDLRLWWRETNANRISLLDYVIGHSRNPVLMGLDSAQHPAYIQVQDEGWTHIDGPAMYLAPKRIISERQAQGRPAVDLRAMCRNR